MIRLSPCSIMVVAGPRLAGSASTAATDAGGAFLIHRRLSISTVLIGEASVRLRICIPGSSASLPAAKSSWRRVGLLHSASSRTFIRAATLLVAEALTRIAEFHAVETTAAASRPTSVSACGASNPCRC